MKFLLTGASTLALALAAQGASAAGLDRSGQSVLPIFADDNTAGLSFGFVNPTLEGEDIGGAGGDYSAGESYTQTGLFYTNRINPQLNYSLIFDEPYGVDIDYDTDPLTSNLGGTFADLDSQALTFVMRYQINDRFSVYGGVKAERVNADVGLNGVAYRDAISGAATVSGFNEQVQAVAPGAPLLTTDQLGAALGGDPATQAQLEQTFGAGTVAGLGQSLQGLQGAFEATGGYDFEMEQDTKAGYVLGFAYEIPDIALRFAATYSPEIEHEGETTEELFGMTETSTTDYVTPQSLNLDFQTGIAPGTLLTASYRWTEFSEVDVIPELLGSDLVNLEDGHRYTVGLGRAFTKEFAGSATFIYEPENDSETVSPLGPTDGLYGITLGGRYTSGALNISGGVNYSWLGDADAGVADQAVASFEDNHAVGIGLRAEFTF
ncbi:Outer membrane protein transport protein (OMPP1/FadL/TodX) [Roseivivax jejudonensis]|uniref:Outer membrane protein transport protein (OMPP1/FadL/TodX) n=1 Tax=Roseivivax jejudonensis TaxID=1529041 RepID=A0A1X6Z2R6_9RHOB|nr:outer membrane protein transport protein [Roseivivax jejudonensis]SLN38362.1 Outer membrane protein transport protein (OMPP1/FadL/TodX) [Roseivivax jejudonensis]